MPSPSRGFALAFGASLVAGAALRLGALTREGLWLDELFTARVATRTSWADVVAELAADVHPPLWFALLHLLPDGGDATWRVPSALVGLLGVALAAGLARALAGGGTHGDRATWLAAALTATAPGLVLLDREARANAALSAATLALVWLAVRPTRRPWAALLVAAALVNLHPFGVFAVVGWVAFLALDPGDGTGLDLRRGLAVAAGAALSLLPWAGVLASQVTHFGASPWYAAPPGDSLGWVLAELADHQPGLWIVPLLGLAVAARQEGPGERRGLLLLGAVAGALVLLPQAVSYAWAPILRTRSALPLLPLVLVVAALGLARMGRAGAVLGIVAALGQGLASWSATRLEVRREQWREAAAWAAERVEPGGLILANHPQLWRHYLGDALDLRDVATPRLDAAPSAVVLVGHDLDDPPALAELGGAVREEARWLGAWARVVGPLSRALPLEVVDPTRGRADGTAAELWGATAARTPDLHARGACAVVVRAHEAAAGAEPARLAVRVRTADAVLLDEALLVAPGELQTTGRVSLTHVGGPATWVEVEFTNDAVVDGADRNVWVDEVRLACAAP